MDFKRTTPRCSFVGVESTGVVLGGAGLSGNGSINEQGMTGKASKK
jgi:hypothetical protein